MKGLIDLIKFYDITKSALEKAEFNAGVLYVCNDTKQIFLDSDNTKERMEINPSIMLVSSLPLAPIPNRLYCDVTNKKLYIYNVDSWIELGGGSSAHKHVYGITIDSTNKTTVEVSDCKSVWKGVFYPDDNLSDLVTSSTVTCANGSITVNIVRKNTTSTYPITGEAILFI